jgi:hypothetical protein
MGEFFSWLAQSSTKISVGLLIHEKNSLKFLSWAIGIFRQLASSKILLNLFESEFPSMFPVSDLFDSETQRSVSGAFWHQSSAHHHLSVIDGTGTSCQVRTSMVMPMHCENNNLPNGRPWQKRMWWSSFTWTQATRDRVQAATAMYTNAKQLEDDGAAAITVKTMREQADSLLAEGNSIAPTVEDDDPTNIKTTHQIIAFAPIHPTPLQRRIHSHGGLFFVLV